MDQNKPLRIGILSTAKIAHKVCLAIQQCENITVTGVASRTLDNAKQWADKHDIEKYFGSYQELIDDPEIDAVYIPLPTGLKKEWTIKAAKQKKHVLVEKPFPSDLQEMIQECKNNFVQFMDGTMWLHSKRTISIKNSLLNIGEIQIINSGFTFKAKDQQWLDGGDIRTDLQLEPYGCLGDLGWYPISAVLFALNYELPIQVKCLSLQKSKVGALIQFIGYLQYSGNRFAQFDCSFISPYRSFFEIVTQNGVIRVGDFVGGEGRSGYTEASFVDYVGGDSYSLDNETGKESIINGLACNHTVLMIKEFCNQIVNQNRDYLWAQKTLLTQQILQCLYQSGEMGGTPIDLI